MGKVTLDEEVIAKWVQRIVNSEKSVEQMSKRLLPLKVEVKDFDYIEFETTVRVSMTSEMLSEISEQFGDNILRQEIILKISDIASFQIKKQIDEYIVKSKKGD